MQVLTPNIVIGGKNKVMKKLLALALTLCLTFGLTVPVSATESNGLDIIVNDTVVVMDTPVQIWNEVTYVSYWPIVQALYPDAVAVWENDRAMISASGLEMEIRPGWKYMIANDRYLYLPDGVRTGNGNLMVPVRTLASALGAEVSWDSINNNIVITAGYAPITSGSIAYQEDVLYWMSHIIHAEAGNQPLEGKIAVGNVVLNRVASPRFPNTVYEVIFQKGQFTPASNGAIKRTPNEESIIAAKLCLDGANTVGNALYFLNPRTATSNWASRTRTFVATIGAHAFYA